uniref:Tf2-1-like SH3-like domain-containing protein n=1 Tax=Cannabis sativa TaxID=3483 RepID=A0A803NIE6_CANSA
MTLVSTIEEILEEQDFQIDELKMHSIRAQQKMKGSENKRQQDEQFHIGERMFVKLIPYRQKTLAARRNEKISPHYFVPCEVLARIKEVAYKLQLPVTSSIHYIFHISPLRRAHGVLQH